MLKCNVAFHSQKARMSLQLAIKSQDQESQKIMEVEEGGKVCNDREVYSILFAYLYGM